MRVALVSSNWETLVHLLKCSLGTGILAMPQAFARAGLVTGVLATIIVGVLVTHCLHVLVSLHHHQHQLTVSLTTLNKTS